MYVGTSGHASGSRVPSLIINDEKTGRAPCRVEAPDLPRPDRHPMMGHERSVMRVKLSPSSEVQSDAWIPRAMHGFPQGISYQDPVLCGSFRCLMVVTATRRTGSSSPRIAAAAVDSPRHIRRARIARCILECTRTLNLTPEIERPGKQRTSPAESRNERKEYTCNRAKFQGSDSSTRTTVHDIVVDCVAAPSPQETNTGTGKRGCGLTASQRKPPSPA